ncbi:MAG: hypothetical protein F6J97_26195 [Leptolyngbya sp. SIO4C1]|nr:hypothetical protein [Leptolyngbya sp. SIO4C1]
MLKKRVSNQAGSDDINFRPGETPLLIRRADRHRQFNPSLNRDEDTSFFEIELVKPIKGFYNWVVFEDHTAIEDAPNNYIIATNSTIVKLRPVDHAQLKEDEKFQFLPEHQPLLANWVAGAENKHVRFELMQPRNGIRNWFAFSEHIEVHGQPIMSPTPAS